MNYELYMAEAIAEAVRAIGVTSAKRMQSRAKSWSRPHAIARGRGWTGRR